MAGGRRFEAEESTFAACRTLETRRLTRNPVVRAAIASGAASRAVQARERAGRAGRWQAQPCRRTLGPRRTFKTRRLRNIWIVATNSTGRARAASSGVGERAAGADNLNPSIAEVADSTGRYIRTAETSHRVKAVVCRESRARRQWKRRRIGTIETFRAKNAIHDR